MPKNLELKAFLNSQSQAIKVAQNLPAQLVGVYKQRDIYYNVNKGRLKLRIINGNSGELIYYCRENTKGSKYSDYIIMPISDYRKLDILLKESLGNLAVVEKKRRVYIYKNSRIHIDSVRGLGKFIEFEVIVKRGALQARNLLNVLIAKFGVYMKDVIAESYSDMVIGNF